MQDTVWVWHKRRVRPSLYHMRFRESTRIVLRCCSDRGQVTRFHICNATVNSLERGSIAQLCYTRLIIFQHRYAMALHLHSAQALCHGARVRAAAAAPVQPYQQQQSLCTFPLHHVWGCAPVSQSNGRSLHSPACCRVVSPEQPASTAPPAQPAGAASAAGAATLPVTESIGSLDESSLTTNVPEDYELAPGVLSSVDRTSPSAPEDAFLCPGCTRAECQVGRQHALCSRRRKFYQQAGLQQLWTGVGWAGDSLYGHMNTNLCSS